jgi:hypothetical protein
MSEDLTFGVAIKGTGDGSLVKDAQAATDELVNLKDAADMTEASYAKLNQQALASGQTWLHGNAAADAAKDKAGALANGYKEVGNQILKTGKEAAEGMEETAFATSKVAASFDKVNAAAAQSHKSIETSAAEFAKLNQEALASGQAWLKGSAAADAAKDKAWALANGYKEVGNQILKTGKDAAVGMEETTFATARAKQEIVVLGREIAQGNFSRIPGSLSIIAQGLSGGVLAGLGVVAAAAAAGAVAWESYGSNIGKVREELDKLSGDLALKTLKDLNKEFDDLEKRAAEKRASASAGGFGWMKDAAEVRVLEEEMRKVGAQIDTNRKKEEAFGDAGGVASKLALQSETAKARELQHQIELLQIYHDKQVAGSNAAIDSESRLQELKKKQSKGDGSEKILADAKRFDEAAFESHKDALEKWADAWQKTEDLLTKMSAAGAAQRAQHQHAASVYMQAELDKRNAATAAADKKEEDALARHLAIQLNRENAYFAQMQAAADNDVKTTASREQKRFERDIIQFQERYEAAVADHNLTLAEKQGFQSALDNINKIHRDNELAQGKANTTEDLATLGKNSEAFLLIYKAAKILTILAAGAERAEYSAAWASAEGGVYAGAAAFAISWAATLANVAVVAGIGGGGGGGGVSAPSGGGSSSPSYGAPNAGNNTPQPTPAPQQTQPVTVNIYNTGNLLSQDYIDSVVIAQIKDRIANADVTIIDPRSRQAQMLAAA